MDKFRCSECEERTQLRPSFVGHYEVNGYCMICDNITVFRRVPPLEVKIDELGGDSDGSD